MRPNSLKSVTTKNNWIARERQRDGHPVTQIVKTSTAKMTHRGGGGGTKAIMFVVMVLIMMVGGNPLPRTEEGDCLVKDSIDVEGQHLPVSLLAYVSRSSNVEMGYFFPGLNRDVDRDSVSINSTGATHSKVRGRKGHFTDISLPRLIPEGWNTFLVDASGRSVTVTLVQGEDRLTLFTLSSLRGKVHSMQARGKVARCSTVTPTWKVNPGEAALVVLQPAGDSTRNQWLEVDGHGWGTDTPHFVFHFTPSSRVNVSNNSTFRITNSVRGEHIHYRVFKEAKTGSGGDGDEEVTSGNVSSSTTSLRVEVGGGRGGDDDSTTTTFVRLQLSPPHTKSMDESVSSSSPDCGTLCIVAFVMAAVMVVGGPLVWVVIDVMRGNGVLVTWQRSFLARRERRRGTRRTEAEGQEGTQGNSSLHMNGAYRGGGSEEGIKSHAPSCDQPLLPNPNGTPIQRDPRC